MSRKNFSMNMFDRNTDGDETDIFSPPAGEIAATSNLNTGNLNNLPKRTVYK